MKRRRRRKRIAAANELPPTATTAVHLRHLCHHFLKHTDPTHHQQSPMSCCADSHDKTRFKPPQRNVNIKGGSIRWLYSKIKYADFIYVASRYRKQLLMALAFARHMTRIVTVQ
jgi:hypothetical protein